MSSPPEAGSPARLLEWAAGPTLAAIELDESRAAEKLRPLFAAIRKLLFQKKLTLKKILAALGTADDGSLRQQLAEAVGQPAWSYVKDARLETGARLLLYTSLPVARIASLVGLKNAVAFRKAFAGFAGTTPVEYRRRARRLLRTAGPPPRDVDDQGYWERALAGELSDAAVRELDAYAASVLPSARGTVSSELVPWVKMRGEMALALADALDELPWKDQRLLVRDAVWFPDASLFNVLSVRSWEVGAEDPERGVELALLAIDTLVMNGLLGVDPGIAVLGWSRVARARWRAGDLPGAEDAWKQVARDLERIPEEDRDPAVEAERSRLEAALRWFQGRREEALKLADVSVARERAGGVGHLARALLLRAEIRSSLHRPRQDERRQLLRGALADLEEARGLADDGWDWEPAALFDIWLLVLGRLGDRKEMATALPEVRRLAEVLDGADAVSHRTGWLEGRANQSWASLWEAREGFLAAGDDLWAARTMLDLLGHLSPDGRPAVEGRLRSLSLASELATALGAMVESSEGAAVVKALQAQAESGTLTKKALDAAGRVHRRLEDDLRARQALRYAGEYPVVVRRRG